MFISKSTNEEAKSVFKEQVLHKVHTQEMMLLENNGGGNMPTKEEIHEAFEGFLEE